MPLFHKKPKETKETKGTAAAASTRWMGGCFSHFVEVNPDGRSTRDKKSVRILNDEGVTQFLLEFAKPQNYTGVVELTVYGDNPLTGDVSEVTAQGFAMLGDFIAHCPEIQTFKVSGLSSAFLLI